MPDTFPTLTVEVAFGSDWQDTLVDDWVWSDGNDAVWSDGNDAVWSTASVWTDITAYVLEGVTTNRGRQKELGQFTTGTAALRLDNTDRRFDPEHTGGAYYPNVKPMVPARIRADFDAGSGTVTYDIWRGFIESWPQSYDLGDTFAVVQASGVDGFAVLAQARSSFRASLRQREAPAARIDAILDAMSWPTRLRDLDTAQTLFVERVDLSSQTLNNNVLSAGTAFSVIQTTAATENARLFMSKDGKVRFEQRHAQLTATSSVTFSDDGSDDAYGDLMFDFSTRDLVNAATITVSANPDPAPATAVLGEYEDATSITTYGEHVTSISTYHVTDAEANGLAEWLVYRGKDPKIRPDRLTVKPRANPTVLFPDVLSIEIGDKVTVERTPQGTGSQISVTCIVEGISHTIGALDWRTDFYLSPTPTADDQGYFVWGTSNWDGSDVWIY